MIRLIDNGDGGEFVIENNDLTIETGLYTQIYLAVFGGSVDEEWFGNLYLLEEEQKQFNSRFEKTINETKINSDSLQKLKSALDYDLSRLVKDGKADKVNTQIQVLKTNKLQINIETILNNISNKFKILYDNKIQKNIMMVI